MGRHQFTAHRPYATGVILLVLALVVAASAAVNSGATARALHDIGGVAVVADPGIPIGVAVSRTYFDSSTSAVLIDPAAPPAARQAGYAAAVERHLPAFDVVAADRDAVGTELRRLGVGQIAVVGNRAVADGLPGTVVDDAAALTSNTAPTTSGTTLAYLVAGASGAAEATAAAAGARVVGVPVADPRATGDSVAALRAAPVAIRAFGEGFGTTADFIGRTEAARTQTQLPGGGQLMFPMRRVVALYGSPDAPGLGPLGAQNLPASIARAKRVAAQYDPVSGPPVIPGFEIIVSVASAGPGDGGNYTNMIDPAQIRPWIEAAGRAGIYVTLDLQPGRMDFLTQAKRYTDLLRMPHVGLALDPEWRLKPNQVHLTQIGSVGADEVNRTSAWLAGLVRDNNLPQKVFVLHQFDLGMLADRTSIITDRPELQVVIHADGHGIPSVKMDTWRHLVTDLPPNVWMGWKNFYTEDHPTFSPARTMKVNPVPWFVSYQ